MQTTNNHFYCILDIFRSLGISLSFHEEGSLSTIIYTIIIDTNKTVRLVMFGRGDNICSSQGMKPFEHAVSTYIDVLFQFGFHRAPLHTKIINQFFLKKRY